MTEFYIRVLSETLGDKVQIRFRVLEEERLGKEYTAEVDPREWEDIRKQMPVACPILHVSIWKQDSHNLDYKLEVPKTLESIKWEGWAQKRQLSNVDTIKLPDIQSLFFKTK